MERLPKLKQHTPINPWRNISEHVGKGDIVYITKPIEEGTFRFQLSKKGFVVEWDEKPENHKAIEDKCLMTLETDEWSNKFIGYAYHGKDGVVLFAIYDLTFHVYLDGITVQRIASSFGFEKHPIVYHGSVKPKENQSVSEFLMEIVSERSRRYKSDATEEQVIIENVSRVYQYRRIIGKWSFVNQQNIPGYDTGKKYILST